MLSNDMEPWPEATNSPHSRQTIVMILFFTLLPSPEQPQTHTAQPKQRELRGLWNSAYGEGQQAVHFWHGARRISKTNRHRIGLTNVLAGCQRLIVAGVSTAAIVPRSNLYGYGSI